MLLTTAATLTAQVPDGWAVASAYQNPSGIAGGLSVFRPHAPTGVVVASPVTGLPVDLTGLGPGQVGNHGANCVLVHPIDGRVIVGEVSQLANDALEIHELTLSGLAVATDTRHLLGTVVAGVRAVDEMAWLPDGRVLFVHFERSTGSELATLDLTTGTVTTIPVTGMPPASRWISMALDPSGATAYVPAWDGANSPIYAVPVPAGGAATLVTTIYGTHVRQLATSPEGDLVASFSAAPWISRWDGARWTVFGNGGFTEESNGMTLDPVTGDLIRVMGWNGGFERVSAAGARSSCANSSGTLITGIALAPSMATHGTATTDAYEWRVAGNPGGLPTVGNAAFGLTATASNGPLPGAVVLGLVPTSQQIAGITLLVNPLVSVGFYLPQATNSVALPLPNTPSLAGTRLFAQAVHAGTSLAASQGLRFTVY